MPDPLTHYAAGGKTSPMLDKTPAPGTVSDLASLASWALLLGLSLWGGVTSFLRKLNSGRVKAWNFTEFIGELTTAGLTGIITANLCDWMNSPAPLKYALVGISSHMGSRALFKLEALVNEKFSLPPDVPTPPTEPKP